LFDEQQALQARQRLWTRAARSSTGPGRRPSSTRPRSEAERAAAAGAIDLATYARAVEDANDRALRSSQAWTDGATRFLKDYVAESNDAATATERVRERLLWCRGRAGRFISSGKLEFQGLADSILPTSRA
jgi:hypothetical protein